MIDAKQEKMSAQLDHWIVLMKEGFCLLKLVDQILRDVHGLKNHLEMMYVKQDRIQSTLTTASVPDQHFFFRSPSSDRTIVTCPSPYASQLSSPPFYATPKQPVVHSVSAYSAPVNTPAATTMQGMSFTPSMQAAFLSPEFDLQSKISLDSFLSLNLDGSSKDEVRTTTSKLGVDFGDSSVVNEPSTLRNPSIGSTRRLAYRSTSSSLLDPDVVLRSLQPITVGYDTIGRISVVLARYFSGTTFFKCPL